MPIKIICGMSRCFMRHCCTITVHRGGMGRHVLALHDGHLLHHPLQRRLLVARDHHCRAVRQPLRHLRAQRWVGCHFRELRKSWASRHPCWLVAVCNRTEKRHPQTARQQHTPTTQRSSPTLSILTQFQSVSLAPQSAHQNLETCTQRNAGARSPAPNLRLKQFAGQGLHEVIAQPLALRCGQLCRQRLLQVLRVLGWCVLWQPQTVGDSGDL